MCSLKPRCGVAPRGHRGGSRRQIQGIDSCRCRSFSTGCRFSARVDQERVMNLNRQSVSRLDRVEVVKGRPHLIRQRTRSEAWINMITAGAVKPFEANLNVSGGSLSALDTRADFGGHDQEPHGVSRSGTAPATGLQFWFPTARRRLGRITSAMTLFKTRYALNPSCRTEFSLRMPTTTMKSAAPLQKPD